MDVYCNKSGQRGVRLWIAPVSRRFNFFKSKKCVPYLTPERTTSASTKSQVSCSIQVLYPLYSAIRFLSFLREPCSCAEVSAQAHSVRRLFTGFAIAARTAWKLSVINATTSISKAAAPKIHQLMAVRYAKF